MKVFLPLSLLMHWHRNIRWYDMVCWDPPAYRPPFALPLVCADPVETIATIIHTMYSLGFLTEPAGLLTSCSSEMTQPRDLIAASLVGSLIGLSYSLKLLAT